MRLDEAGEDACGGVDIARVEPDRQAVRERADAGQRSLIAAVVIDNLVAAEDAWPDHLPQLVGRIGAMRARPAQKHDSIVRHAECTQLIE
jgi:hypothetical protein